MAFCRAEIIYGIARAYLVIRDNIAVAIGDLDVELVASIAEGLRRCNEVCGKNYKASVHVYNKNTEKISKIIEKRALSEYVKYCGEDIIEASKNYKDSTVRFLCVELNGHSFLDIFEAWDNKMQRSGMMVFMGKYEFENEFFSLEQGTWYYLHGVYRIESPITLFYKKRPK